MANNKLKKSIVETVVSATDGMELDESRDFLSDIIGTLQDKVNFLQFEIDCQRVEQQASYEQDN